jgi:hypothetical protein
MAIQFEIKELICSESIDGFENIIVTVNYNAIKDGVSIPGSLGLTSPIESAFKPFEEITEELVISWLESSLNLQEIEFALDCEIAYKMDVIVSKPLPRL